MTSITFVRHGITGYNVEGRTQGHTHNPLSEMGRQQAVAVAKRLAEESWDVLISSDLMRARQTAECIAAAIGIPISLFDVRLREIDRGLITGTIESERIEKWGKDWRQLELGEESNLSMQKRGSSCIQELVLKYPNQKLLLVSHGLIIIETLKALMGSEDIEVLEKLETLGNTSVTTIVQQGEQWKFERINCTQHLL